MRVAIRADASTVLGHGHVKRCLALAGELRERGASVCFVSRASRGDLCALVEHSGFQVLRLREIEDDSGQGARGSRSDTASQADATQTLGVLSEVGAMPDWLIVDHYALDSRWESALRAHVGRIMVIDDLADRPHECDLLLDQNLATHPYRRYLGKVPERCSILPGPRYALLERTYRKLRERVVPRAGAITRILISFGGADEDNLTGRAVNALLQLRVPRIKVDVVITDSNPNGTVLQRQAADHDNIRIIRNAPTLAPLMAEADLSIGAGGTSCWERLCLGLPALVVTSADNQLSVAEELQRLGLIIWLGHRGAVDESAIAAALDELIQRGLEADWSQRCLAAVDGLGAVRVGAALMGPATAELRARRAQPGDEALLLEWANDPVTRSNGFYADPISPETHHEWFQARLRGGSGCHLYIVETADGLEIGQVRFERSGAEWEVHYSVAPAFRGRGMGGAVLQAALQELRRSEQSVPVFGRVKLDNQPSRRIFTVLGFEEHAEPGHGLAIYRRML